MDNIVKNTQDIDIDLDISLPLTLHEKNEGHSYPNLQNKTPREVKGFRPVADTQGFRASSDNERVPPNRESLLAQKRLEIERRHSQVRRVLHWLDKSLVDATKQEQGKALIELVLNRAYAPNNSPLNKEVKNLQDLITVFDPQELENLDQVAQGKTAKVLLDIQSKNVYKIIDIDNGLVGGTFPGEIRHRKEDNQVLVSGCRKHNLIDCIQAVLIANKQGKCLFTEIAGVTTQNDLVLKQAYIHDLTPIEIFEEDSLHISTALKKALDKLDMLLIGDIGSPFAMSKVVNKLAIFDDLHGENLLLNSKGDPVIVDSLATRLLTVPEITMLKEYFINKTSSIEKKKLKNYFKSFLSKSQKNPKSHHITSPEL
jgi:hypothetical protein